MPRIRKVWKQWSPKDYLNEYYKTSEIPSDERAIFSFLNERLQKKSDKFKIGIEFGSGPTLHHAVCLVPFVEELHLADYVNENLAESQKWLDNHPEAHDWDVYFEGVLNLTNNPNETVEERKAEMKRKITKLHFGDLNLRHPLGKEASYPLVASFYCADSATHSKSQWKKYVNNLFNLIEPGGQIFLSALRNSSGYKVGKLVFPSANVDEDDFWEVFNEAGFKSGSVDIEVAKVEEWKEEGFDSIVLVSARNEK